MRFILLSVLIFLGVTQTFGQSFYEFNGRVKDSVTKEVLVNATLIINPGGKGIISDINGNFSVKLQEGTYTIQVSYLGYVSKSETFGLHENHEKNFFLSPKNQNLNTIDVNAKRHDDPIKSTEIGTVTLQSKQITNLPALMGEPDIINAIRLSPGIQGVGEGNPGLYVRGGDAGQNLILLDDMVLYNPSHLLGFFPVFNSGIIDEVTVYKGGFPAQYGGRISSVIDIKMKEPNQQKIAGSTNVGLLSSGLVLEAPLVKDKGGIIISARRTYLELIEKGINPLLKPESRLFNGTSYHFYDASAKAKYALGKKTRLNIMAFTSNDNYHLTDDNYKIDNFMFWNNTVGSISLNHSFSDKLNMNISTGKTLYNFNIDAALDQYGLNLNSGIDDWKNNIDFIYMRKPKLPMKFGLAYTHHILTPNRVDVEINDLTYKDVNKYYSNECAAYMNENFKFSEKLSISAGARYTCFQHVGPYTFYYRDDAGKVNDSTKFDRNENVALYQSLDPNIIWVYVLDSLTSVKGSISQTHQYIHLASVGSVSLPTDIWLPSTRFIKPQQVSQVSLGLFKNFKWNSLETSLEIYYKDMRNQIDFLNGILDNFDNSRIEKNIITGVGRAMGAELYIKKSVGKTTGWISYSLSRTLRRYEEINNDKWFPAKYDRVHDLSITVNHKLNEKWNFSAVFIYATGNAMTLPVGRYIIQGNVANQYTDVNAFRMPAYHRLDINANYTLRTDEKYESVLHFSIYNVYNRSNPYFIYFRAEGNLDEYRLSVTPKQMSLFPILPSVSWTLNF